MATVNGTDYYFIDMQQASGGNITHHLLKDKAGRDAVAPTEASSTASAAHATGSYFFYNGVLYQATADIASGGTITPNTNCVAVNVGGEVSALKGAFNAVLCPAEFSPSITASSYITDTGAAAAASSGKYARTSSLFNGYGTRIAIMMDNPVYEIQLVFYDATAGSTPSTTGFIRRDDYSSGIHYISGWS